MVSFGACDGLLVGILSSYRLPARRCDDSFARSLRVFACACHEAGTAGGRLHPFHFRISTASLSHHLSFRSATYTFSGCHFQSREVDDGTYLYPATSSTLNKGSAVFATMAAIFRTDKPHPKCSPGMISVGHQGVESMRIALLEICIPLNLSDL